MRGCNEDNTNVLIRQLGMVAMMAEFPPPPLPLGPNKPEV